MDQVAAADPPKPRRRTSLIVTAVLAAVLVGVFGYDQFWLIFGLIAWALSAATGILFLGPEAKRLNTIAAEHGPKSPEAQARLRRILLVARADMVLLFVIVLDMVAKPFS